jgi:hypothetical protein
MPCPLAAATSASLRHTLSVLWSAAIHRVFFCAMVEKAPSSGSFVLDPPECCCNLFGRTRGLATGILGHDHRFGARHIRRVGRGRGHIQHELSQSMFDGAGRFAPNHRYSCPTTKRIRSTKQPNQWKQKAHRGQQQTERIAICSTNMSNGTEKQREHEDEPNKCR